MKSSLAGGPDEFQEGAQPMSAAAAAEAPEEKLFTTADAARFCGVSFHTIVYNSGIGKIAPARTADGGTMMFAEADLRKLAAEKGWTTSED
jgi:hypothetical protein